MNYVMKCIQVFDKNKISWQNYNSCVTRYNDPNGMIVLMLLDRTFLQNWW